MVNNHIEKGKPFLALHLPFPKVIAIHDSLKTQSVGFTERSEFLDSRL